MRAADTSVVIAAFASWHEHHEPARRALDTGLRLVDHCALESYSVLTRLPAPHRSAPALVLEFLEARFPRPWLCLSEAAYHGFLRSLPTRGVAGGALYDALVAATAVACDVELVSCDRRALTTYERMGVRATLLS